jgi:hypothetical protein
MLDTLQKLGLPSLNGGLGGQKQSLIRLIVPFLIEVGYDSFRNTTKHRLSRRFHKTY